MTEYLTLAEVVGIHKVLINRYGGSEGLRDAGALESAIYRPQSGYYKDLIWEAAALMESLVMNHPFVDGNKRIAFAATDVFLRINGYKIQASSDVIYQFMMDLFQQGKFEINEIEKFLRKNTMRK